MMSSPCPAKKISEKLARIISNSLTVSEIKIYNRAEKADALSFDALYLWALKTQFGFSAEQLIDLYKSVATKALDLKDYSLSGNFIPQVELLKEYGVNLHELAKEEF